MSERRITARALQVSTRIDLRAAPFEDTFSHAPLAFHTRDGGTAVVFRSGTVVLIDVGAPQEAEIMRALEGRLGDPLPERESESAQILVGPREEDRVTTAGVILLQAADPVRLLLIAEALASSTALALEERRIAQAFERVDPLVEDLMASRLPQAPQARLLRQIGEVLQIQRRLADRLDHDDKPDVLWDHPQHERLWARLVEEYDLTQRARAIARKLDGMQEMARTATALPSTRTSHRLEWYIIALIALEIVLGLYDRITGA